MFRASIQRSAARAAGALAGAGFLVVLGTGTASAHVHGYAEPAVGTKAPVTFTVPNERADSGTVRVQVTFPEDTPMSTVTTKSVPGWTATVRTEKLDQPVQRGETTVSEAVRSVTWTAERGTSIGDGQYQEFELSVGPLPEDGGTLITPATQTYDNGEVVRWDQASAADGSEPERPAPEIDLPSPADEGHGSGGDGEHASSGHGGDDGGAEASEDGEQASAASDSTARWLGGGGLALGALGLGLGAGAVLRARRAGRSG